MITIAIPDVHGDAIALEKAISACESWLRHNGVSASYLFLGDLIDRGPDPKNVLKIVSSMVESGAILLLGNHEEMLIGTAEKTNIVFSDGSTYKNSAVWLNNGGDETIKHLTGKRFFKTEEELAQALVDTEEYHFLKKNAKLFHHTDCVFFSHAPQSDVKNVTDSTLTWGRISDYKAQDSSFKVPMDKDISIHGHFNRLPYNFARVLTYKHGGRSKTVVLADGGCGYDGGMLHPIIVLDQRESACLLAIL